MEGRKGEEEEEERCFNQRSSFASLTGFSFRNAISLFCTVNNWWSESSPSLSTDTDDASESVPSSTIAKHFG